MRAETRSDGRQVDLLTRKPRKLPSFRISGYGVSSTAFRTFCHDHTVQRASSTVFRLDERLRDVFQCKAMQLIVCEAIVAAGSSEVGQGRSEEGGDLVGEVDSTMHAGRLSQT